VSGFNAQVEEQGQVAEERLLEVGWVLAPEEVAVRLGVEQDADVAARRRLFVVNDEPVALCDSYYPSEVARGTPLAEPERTDRQWRVRADRGCGGADRADAAALDRRSGVPDADAA